MARDGLERGLAELATARRRDRGLYWIVGLFGIFVNLLMLTGPVYMLQVYDRVLTSKSAETLLALSLLAVFLFVLMGVIDVARARLAGRIGARLHARLQERVFMAAERDDAAGQGSLGDLASIERAYASPIALAAYDLVWVPLFVIAIAIFHPWLGWMAVAGGLTLIALALGNHAALRLAARGAAQKAARAERLAGRFHDPALRLAFAGRRRSHYPVWRNARQAASREALQVGDVSGWFGTAIRTFRMLLQSAMLGMGAWLALQGEMSPGAMIAGSILLARALAPIEVVVAQWPVADRARRGWASLADLLGRVPAPVRATALPRPRAVLEVRQASIALPGDRIARVRMLNFQLHPGQALGVIGPSGAGKTVLARALIGHVAPAAGEIRLDGAALDQFGAADLGRYVGYLPQNAMLFEGSVAENISGFAPDRDDNAIIAAAKAAGAHDMILALSGGYDTAVGPAGCGLSGGQISADRTCARTIRRAGCAGAG